MRFAIQKQPFLQALQTVTKAVPGRTTKPILYGIQIEATHNQLILTGYDLEFGIEVVIANQEENDTPIVQVEDPGAIVLNARYLLDIIRKLPHHLVRIDTQDLIATIQSGRATYTINGMDSREYPSLPQINDDRGFGIAASLLRELIEHTAFAAAVSEARPVLTGVLWKYEDGRLSLSATDSHRMATHSAEVETQKDYALMESIIPGKSLQELAKILPDDSLIANVMIADQQLLISFGSIQFFSRLIEGRYPDVTRIIPQTHRTAITIAVRSLQDCVERAALLARDTENQVIRIQLRRTHIEISSHSPEIGKITENIEPETFEGEELILACNARFLLDALKSIPGDKVLIEFTGAGSAFVLKPLNEDHHIQLMQPVRQVHL